MKLRDKPRLLGALEGEIWISDDFNDCSFDLVSESEKQLLDTVRTSNKTIQRQKAAV